MRSFTFGLLTGSMLLALPAFAADGAAPATPASAGALPRAEVEGIVKEYLMSNPQVIIDAVEVYRKKQADEMQAKLQKAAVENRDKLFSGDAPTLGDAKTADVHMVEFFDYHCGYCKQMLPAIVQLNKDDPKVLVHFMDFPILSKDSVEAAKAAIAVHRLNKAKYFDFHSDLMKATGKFDEKRLMEISKKHGIDEKALKEEMAKPEVDAQIKKTRELASAIGVTGTPMVMVEDQVLPGAASLEDLKAAVKKAREAKAGKK